MYYYSGCHIYKYQLSRCYLLPCKTMTLQMAGFTRSTLPPSVWEGKCNLHGEFCASCRNLLFFFFSCSHAQSSPFCEILKNSSSISRLDMCRMKGTPHEQGIYQNLGHALNSCVRWVPYYHEPLILELYCYTLTDVPEISQCIGRVLKFLGFPPNMGGHLTFLGGLFHIL